MKKHLLIGGAIALCLVGVMFVAQADNEVLVRKNNQDSYGRRRHRGPVIATIDGAGDAVRGTAKAIGNIFTGGGRRHNEYPRSQDNDGYRNRR